MHGDSAAREFAAAVDNMFEDKLKPIRDWLTRIERKQEQQDRTISHSWRKVAVTILAPLCVAVAGGWFSLQETQAEMKDKAAERARQDVAGEVTERIAQKAARMALEAYEKAREQQVRKLIRQSRLQEPMKKNPDIVTEK